VGAFTGSPFLCQTTAAFCNASSFLRFVVIEDSEQTTFKCCLNFSLVPVRNLLLLQFGNLLARRNSFEKGHSAILSRPSQLTNSEGVMYARCWRGDTLCWE